MRAFSPSRGNITMILEVAILNIRPGESADFERAFSEAQAIIASRPGFISYQLLRCLECLTNTSFWSTGEPSQITRRASAIAAISGMETVTAPFL